MEFLNEVSEKEFQVIKELDKTIPQTPKNGTCYWVKVDKNDFLPRRHCAEKVIVEHKDFQS